MTLDDWLAQSALKDHEFATRIGVSRVTLFRIKTGRRTPSREVMERIHDATNGAVEPNDFFDLVPSPSNTGEAA
jgi:transcriptional regulator with XRE-family HTH domain